MTTTSVATIRTGATQIVPAHPHSVRTPRAGYASAPMTTSGPIFTHECHHGFCTVCGSVWPCSRAERTTARRTPPILRSDALAY
jgi:hypothetical protein